MDLHMIEFSGTTFGMKVQNPVAFQRLKKSVFVAKITSRHSIWRRKELCVMASDVAAVMGDAAWLVSEGKYMERIRWADTGWRYIIYDVEKQIYKPIKPIIGPVFYFK